jgi:beta-galactosidase
VIVPSERLERALSPLHPRVMRTPKGFDPELFYDIDERSGPLSVGWAGALKPDKGVWFIRKGLRERPRMATNLPYSSMPGFYNSLDVITCASEAEGDPRTLIEGMSPGEAASIHVEIDESGIPLSENETDLVFVYANVIDKNNTVLPYFNQAVTFVIEGGELIGENPVKAEAGIASILLKVKKGTQKIEIHAIAGGLRGSISVK